jgi:Fungal cellulose binding domain
MKLTLALFLHGALIFAKAQRGADEPANGRGLRGATGGTAAPTMCLRDGEACEWKAACCSGECLDGMCATGTLETALPETDQCVVEDQAQCNGAGYAGCKTCRGGSGCVYSTKDLSVCLPGYVGVSDVCVVNDGEQCGGQGYSGCQNCKAGSQCVEVSPLSSICYAGGTVPDETAPIIADDTLVDIGTWVKGIDRDLDDEIFMLGRRRLQQANATNVDLDEVRQRISKAFASEKGLKRAQNLMQNSPTFQKFNADSAAELQDVLCSSFQSPTALVSAEVKACICGDSDKPFVYCAALLEQEMNHHMETRRDRRNRRQLNTVARQLPSCKLNIEGIGKGDGFMKYAAAVSNQLSDMTPSSAEEGAGDLCGGGECGFPLAPLPLEAIAGVEACAPTPGVLKENVKEIEEIDVRRAAAGKTSASIFAKICLVGAGEMEAATDILEFYGLDLCPIQFKGSIRPLMGVLEGEMTAALAMLYVKGSLMLQYETKTRNKLRLCDGATCSNGENEDCAMCEGDLKTSLEFGIKLLFISFKMTLAEKNVISKCSASSDSGNGQCSSGLATSDPSKWEDGKICGLGTTCNQCANPATYWTSKLFTACGTEPCWKDGTVCLAGTTCKKCCNTARDALGTKCGGAKWKDGTACGVGTTCNLCENKATWWDRKFFTACGTEPCWKDGTVCGAGTTCKKCCNTARDALGTKCGGAKWKDGTACGFGTTCNFCENKATWWDSKFMTACGTEPCWEDGKVCGAGTTCKKCCNTARDALGTKCGGAKWKDGTACGLGTTCNFCENPATWWDSKFFTACGTEPRWEDGTACAMGTTCNKCKNPASFWARKFFTACGRDPCWGGGTRCLGGTTCNECCNGSSWRWRQFGHFCN